MLNALYVQQKDMYNSNNSNNCKSTPTVKINNAKSQVAQVLYRTVLPMVHGWYICIGIGEPFCILLIKLPVAYFCTFCYPMGNCFVHILPLVISNVSL